MAARPCAQGVKCSSTGSEGRTTWPNDVYGKSDGHVQCSRMVFQSNRTLETSVLKQMKLGVALAVIRSKPPSRTAKEHTEHLSSLFMTSQHKYQERWERSQEEVLNLKQQLLMSHFGWQTSQNTGDENMFDSQPLFPTPPSSSEVSDRDPSVVVQRETLHTDIAFLQSIINLDRSGGGKVKVNHDLHKSEVTWATVEHSLKCVGEMLSDPTRPLTTSFLPQAMRSVVSVLEQDSADGKLQHCRGTLLGVLSSIIQRILTADTFQHSGETTRLLQLLSCFSQIKSLTLLQEVLCMFCHHIEKTAVHLRQAQGAKVDFCPILAENMYYIIVAMETCVHNTVLLTTRAGHTVCGQVQERLEGCLVHLTRPYPILAQAVWRVTNLLELCVTKNA